MPLGSGQFDTKGRRLPWVRPPNIPKSKAGDKWFDLLIRRVDEDKGYPLKDGETTFEYEKKLDQNKFLHGSRYPPFNIEPMRDIRDRLYGDEGKGMTPEQRAMRARWVKEQNLAPDEPRYVPMPRNVFRRTYAKPMNAIYHATYALRNTFLFWKPRKVLPPSEDRKVIPLVLGLYLGFVFFYYHLKYNHMTWENPRYNFKVYMVHRPNYNDLQIPKEETLYYDHGFSKRKVLLNE